MLTIVSEGATRVADERHASGTSEISVGSRGSDHIRQMVISIDSSVSLDRFAIVPLETCGQRASVSDWLLIRVAWYPAKR